MKLKHYEWPIAAFGLLLWLPGLLMRSLLRLLSRRPRLSEHYDAELGI